MEKIKKTILRSGCKINLFLQITSRLSGGWHELDTVFLPLPEPFDQMTLTRIEDERGLVVECSSPGIDVNSNTLTKAYTLFAEATGFTPGICVFLEKGVPSGAGLGGGSADAAVFLRWLNSLAPKPLSFADLSQIALHVGADVPFFLLGTPCRAQGKGEILTPCTLPQALVGNEVVLVCPRVFVSTPWAYTAWDAWSEKHSGDLTKGNGWRTDLHSPRLLTEQRFTAHLENSFEPPVFEAFPELRQLKETLLCLGARAAVLSGSGSALFGLFRTKEEASKAETAMREKDVAVFRHTL